MKQLLTGILLLGLLAGTALASAPQPEDPESYDKSWWQAQENKTIQHAYAADHLLITLQRSVVDQFRSSGALRSVDLPEIHQLNLEQNYSAFKRIVDNDGQLDQVALDHDLDLYYLIEFEAPQDIENLIWLYEGIPAIEEARPDYIVHTMITPNDYYYPSQWAHNNTGQAARYGGGTVGTPDCDIDSPQAWDISTGASGVTIAILDTGVDLDHAEFAGRIVPGYDFVNNDNTAQDDNMHGTACAGIAAARGNNSSGVAGIAWNSMIMPIKILNSNGSGYTSDIVDGVNWARVNGADVISMSLGGGGYDASFNSAITAAHNAGVIVISAAGNDNSSNISYPAAYSNSMAIGALSPCNERKSPSSCDNETWWGSNYGSGLDVMAPGTRLHTTYYTGGYMSDMNGTSGATPHVAGVAALIMSVNPALSASEVWDIINNSADDLGTNGWDTTFGWGRLNAYQALLQSGGGTEPILNYSSHSISDANGQLDPGETNDLYVTLYNAGAEATSVSVTLSESSPYISLGTAYQSYGTIGSGSSDTNSNPFVISADPGTPVGTTVTINMSISASGYSNSDSFTITVGTPPEFTECNDTPYSIPDNNTTGINSPMTVSQSVNIIDLEVFVDITHTYRADLLIRLTSPDGTNVTLHNRSGGSANNIVGWYDTDLPVDGPGSLSDFFGENTAGTWTLHVDDNYAQDTGTLNEWCLWVSGEDEDPENTPPAVSDIPNQYMTEGDGFNQIYLDNYVTDAETPDASIIWTYAGNSELSVNIVNRVATIVLPDPDWNGLETITFTATDQGGLQDSDPATFWMQGVNDAPVVTDIPNQTIDGGDSFAQIHLDNYVSDAEDADASIIWVYSGNSDLQVDITNRVATISYDGGWSGSETITFTAWDTGGMSDSDNAVFTVEQAANTPPAVSDIPNQMIDEGDSFTQINLDNYVTDVETADDDIIWTYTGNSELTVSIVNRVATIGIPDPDWYGLETITFTATDEGGLQDDDPAIFWVEAVNDAPVVTNIPNQTVDEDQPFAQIQLDNYVSDVEDEDASIIWVYSGNTDLMVDITNRVATITADSDWNGAETITFTAWDTEGQYDNDTVLFTVDPVNDAPEVADIPNQYVNEGQPFVQIDLDDYVADVEDPDNAIDWTWTGNSEMVVDITDRIATITYPGLDRWSGSETITFTATDAGDLTDSDAATFSVGEVNDSPVVIDIPDQSVNEGESFVQIDLDDYVEDEETPDAQIVWTYYGNSELTVSIVDRVATITVPDPDWFGAETVTFVATDEGDLDASDPATFTVDPVNDAPVVSNIPDQEVDAGDDFIQIDLDDFVEDVETPDNAIDWNYTGAIDLVVDITDRIATITYDAGWSGSETITFTATDIGDLSDSDAASFTVFPSVDPVDDLTITWQNPGVLLEWSPLPGAVNYSVYRMLEPYAVNSAVFVQTVSGTSVSLDGEAAYGRAFYFVVVNY
jgi:subtilisin family serine protease/subtilisin-like proprotein convertase family protein